MAMVIAFAGMAALALVAVTQQQTEAAVSPGTIYIQANWDPQLNADVDLWVKAPNDRPVGYSNKGGLYFNLLRDDLGRGAGLDPLDLNQEIAVGRGTPAGEYVVNVHLYRAHGGSPLTDVRVVASVQTKGPPIELFTRTVTLRREGEEITVARFSLTADGYLVPGSLSSLHRPLRSAKTP